jgi:hypothetical protein
MQGAGLHLRLVQPGSRNWRGDPRLEGIRMVLRRGDGSHLAQANPFRWVGAAALPR